MFFTNSFILSWTIWILLADKSRWREIFPVCFLASYFALITDILVEFYPLWGYTGNESPLWIQFSNALGIFIVAIYLLIQWLPRKKTFLKLFTYLFAWTSFAVLVEQIHLATGHMYYRQWWSIWYSYLADWLLFWTFYKFHEVFRLERLK
ncbi:hypothetical protein Ga0466249_003817 [Sporomusaceae bacterium BoRhaA]|uniref:CBO0543 family protein n=1 Tax=Pelorhabdus rhamnosifermentans TaxID=2772457 RepID=UPI001C06449C|nr:CBO0543 family protein [Pelorhabdus rhamnosifermentans]MBU2702682.1 hypothetical protein [Pelorhabdus rhamnosifermentans]